MATLARLLCRWPVHMLLLLVRGYRFWLKPWLGNACRFEPSCSAYAMQALQQHGALKGSALSGWRLMRCQPWCEGGCDPVPDTSRGAGHGLFTRFDPSSKTSATPAAPETVSKTRI